jgi:hypothetical protein
MSTGVLQGYRSTSGVQENYRSTGVHGHRYSSVVQGCRCITVILVLVLYRGTGVAQGYQRSTGIEQGFRSRTGLHGIIGMVTM